MDTLNLARNDSILVMVAH